MKLLARPHALTRPEEELVSGRSPGRSEEGVATIFADLHQGGDPVFAGNQIVRADGRDRTRSGQLFAGDALDPLAGDLQRHLVRGGRDDRTR